MSKGLLLVLTGNGKGKSSSAAGPWPLGMWWGTTPAEPGRPYLSLGLVVALHILMLGGMLQYRPQPGIPLQAAQPMMVALVSLPVPEPQPIVAPPDPATAQSGGGKPIPPKPKKPAPRPKAINIHAAEEAAPAPRPAAPRALKGTPNEPPPERVPPRFSADYLRNPAPQYPRISRRLGEKGRVLLKVLVGPDGRAEQVKVNQSSGFTRLDAAAQDAVEKWMFVPAKLGEWSIRAWVIVPIVFTLKG